MAAARGQGSGWPSVRSTCSPEATDTPSPCTERTWGSASPGRGCLAGGRAGWEPAALGEWVRAPPSCCNIPLAILFFSSKVVIGKCKHEKKQKKKKSPRVSHRKENLIRIVIRGSLEHSLRPGWGEAEGTQARTWLLPAGLSPGPGIRPAWAGFRGHTARALSDGGAWGGGERQRPRLSPPQAAGARATAGRGFREGDLLGLCSFTRGFGAREEGLSPQGWPLLPRTVPQTRTLQEQGDLGLLWRPRGDTLQPLAPGAEQAGWAQWALNVSDPRLLGACSNPS